MENPIFISFREFDKAMRQPTDTHLTEEYTGNRSIYDDIGKRDKYKQAVFNGKATITDTITGKTLHANRQAAIKKYGSARATHHTADVDHIVPLEQIHNMAKPLGLSDQDVREIANSESNLIVTQSHLNRKKQSDLNFEVAAKSLQEGNYRESIMLIEKGIQAHTAVGAKVMDAAATKQAEKMVKGTYQAIRHTAEAISPELASDVERKISQSAQELKKSVGEDLHSAAIPLTIATVNALVSVAKDEKSLREAGKDVVVQTGTVVATTELQKMGINAANQALKQSGVQVLKQAAKANVVAHAVTIGFMVKDSVVSWLDGDIDDGEFFKQVSRTGTLFAAELLAAETIGTMVGQSVIPIPVVGAVVGSMVATVACGCIFSLMDAAKNHIAEDKRNLVAKIAADALREMEHQQNLLKEYIADDKAKWDKHVGEGFALIATGMRENDVEIIAGGLDCILTNFHRHVKFSSYEEFDDFFMDENAVLKL